MIIIAITMIIFVTMTVIAARPPFCHQVMDGKAYCVIHKQGLLTIDINGQMDEQAICN